MNNPTDNPFSPPRTTTTLQLVDGESWRDGESVVVSPRSVLPPRCVSCNQPASNSIRFRMNHSERTAPQWGRNEVLVVAVAILGWLGLAATIVQTGCWHLHPFFSAVVLLLLAFGTGMWVSRKLWSDLQPIAFGFCRRHFWFYQLRFVGVCVGYLLWLAAGTAWEFRNFPPFSQVEPMPLVIVGLSLVLLATLTNRFFPAVAKCRGGNRWISGCSAAFVADLPLYLAGEDLPPPVDP